MTLINWLMLIISIGIIGIMIWQLFFFNSFYKFLVKYF